MADKYLSKLSKRFYLPVPADVRRKISSAGGKARAAKLSKKRLRQIAMMGVKARRRKLNAEKIVA